jgi:TolA-binding protein
LRINKRNRLFFLISLLFISGCAYYNTLFNALKVYDAASKKLSESKETEIPADIRKDFNSAIDKCWKLINLYSDSSKYADDAFLLIAKSHYQIAEYTNSERYLSQFISRYPQSKLLPEATLWLAKSLIKLGKTDQASEYLNSIIAETSQKDITAQAYYYLAYIFLQQKNYEPTLNNLHNCIARSDDDYLSSSAQLIIGDIYLAEEDYAKAIENYDLVGKYSAPVKVDFEAQSKKVSTLILMKDYRQAIETLSGLLNQSRFVDYYAYFEARLGECFTLQNNYDLAVEKFNYILEKYPRSEGAGIAAYRLAQLQETYFADPDSAQQLYLRVEKEDRNSKYKDDAVKHAQLLQAYLKIKDSINKDIAELASANSADSLAIKSANDSSVIRPDTLAVKPSAKARKDVKKTEVSQPKRSLTQIKTSLDKNRFALGEFFLLNIQYFDSAQVAYQEFITNSADSSLIAKAYYALYYIAAYAQADTNNAEKYKNIILTQFPSSVYAGYLRVKSETVPSEKLMITDSTKTEYLRAESLLFSDRYDEAIELFNQIAIQDSGTLWAEKARYAVAWTYERKLGNLTKAIEAYTKLAQEYPNSAIAQIAKNKIKIPVETVEKDKEIPAADSSSFHKQDTLTVPIADSTRFIPPESKPVDQR